MPIFQLPLLAAQRLQEEGRALSGPLAFLISPVDRHINDAQDFNRPTHQGLQLLGRLFRTVYSMIRLNDVEQPVLRVQHHFARCVRQGDAVLLQLVT